MKHLTFYLLVLGIASCSPSTKIIKSEIAEGVNLSQFKTFDFYTLEASGDTISARFAQRSAMLKSAIADELTQKGYRQASGNADLMVNIGISVTEDVQTRQTDFRTDAPRYTGQRRYSWKSQEVEVGRYRTGTVDIHLVDARKNMMVWQKVAEGIIADSDKKLEAQVKEGMKKVFADFPRSALP